MPRYQAPLRDMKFLLNEVLEIGSYSNLPRFADAPEDVIDAVLDGELLIKRGGGVQDFNTLQQRLNRKTVTAKILAEFPAFIRVYDLLALGEADLRALPFSERRVMLERFVADHPLAPIDLSPLITFDTWAELSAARADPAHAEPGDERREHALQVEQQRGGRALHRDQAPHEQGRTDHPADDHRAREPGQVRARQGCFGRCL